MAKGKKFIKINPSEEEEFGTKLLSAMLLGNISINGDYIEMAIPLNEEDLVRGRITINDLEFQYIKSTISDFKKFWNDNNLHDIPVNIINELSPRLTSQKDSINMADLVGLVSVLMVYTDPVYKKLELEDFDKLELAIIEKFNPDSEIYNAEEVENFISEFIRISMYFRVHKPMVYNSFDKRNYAMYFNDSKLNEIIDRFIEYGIFNKDYRLILGYYDCIKASQILELFDNGEISESELFQIGKQKGIEAELIKLSREKKPSKKYIQMYMRFLDKQTKISLINEMKSLDNFWQYFDITKEEIIIYSSGEDLVKIIQSGKLPDDMQITSEDILYYYGRSNEDGKTIINGTKLYSLIYGDCVDSKAVIDIIAKNQILEMTGEEDLFDKDEVLSYYSSERLSAMFLLGEIDTEFIKKYKNILGEDFERKSEQIVEAIKNQIMNNPESGKSEEEKERLCQQRIMEAYNIGICTANSLKENISSEYIANEYINSAISAEELLNLYKKGVIDKSVIEQNFTTDELFDLYMNREISFDMVIRASDPDKFKDKVISAIFDDEMPVGDVVKAYMQGTMSLETIKELKQMLSDIDDTLDIDFSPFIDENTNFDRIKELYQNDLIDYSFIFDLQSRDIITQEQFNELKNDRSKQEFINNLKGKTIFLYTSREYDFNPSEIMGSQRNSMEIDYEYERSLIAAMFPDIDTEKLDNYAIIRSYGKNNRPTTLDKYLILPSEETGLVIFTKLKKNNATFVMPYQQAAYFLHTETEMSDSDIIAVKNRMSDRQDKKSLSELSQVRKICHGKYFGTKFKEACCELSEEIAKKYANNQGYCNAVQQFILEWERHYLERRKELEQ